MSNNTIVHLYHDSNLFNDSEESFEYIASLEFKDVRSNIDMLESVMALSQNIIEPWINNENFLISKNIKQCRSTSVGDQFIIVDANSTTTRYIVADFGFDLLEDILS